MTLENPALNDSHGRGGHSLGVPANNGEGRTEMTEPVKKSKNDDKTIVQRIGEAIDNAINLQVVTCVGKVEIVGEVDDCKVEFAPDPDGTRETFVTNINLIDGDIVNVIPPAYAGQADNPVMKYHVDQVAQANAIVQRNLDTLAKLIKDIVPAFKGLEAVESKKPKSGGR
jgi:hypothetical protein